MEQSVNSVSMTMCMETCKTVGGSPVLIFTKDAGGISPWLGAYYSGEEWIPAKWLSDGKYPSINEHLSRPSLDLDLESTKPQVA